MLAGVACAILGKGPAQAKSTSTKNIDRRVSVFRNERRWGEGGRKKERGNGGARVAVSGRQESAGPRRVIPRARKWGNGECDWDSAAADTATGGRPNSCLQPQEGPPSFNGR